MSQQQGSAIPLRRRIYRPYIYLTLVVHIFAIAALFQATQRGIIAFGIVYGITGCFGISLGYHRLLTHRTFQAPPWLETFLTLCGAISLQGGPIRWAASHRAHHRHEDRTGDAHARSRGFLWSHMLWTFMKAPNGFRSRHLARQVPDVASRPAVAWIERHYVAINLVAHGALFLAAPLDVFLWAGPARIVALWHMTWAVNSIAHGGHDGQSTAESSSRDVPLLALVTFGEGYHRSHHQHPGRAHYTRRALSVDTGYMILRTLAALRLVAFRTT